MYGHSQETAFTNRRHARYGKFGLPVVVLVEDNQYPRTFGDKQTTYRQKSDIPGDGEILGQYGG